MEPDFTYFVGTFFSLMGIGLLMTGGIAGTKDPNVA